ncbi:hypothetical protein OC844_001649 [Tilletia horrida]|nr:hypothetical protein OC844_001649 [Tilletia horrida]
MSYHLHPASAARRPQDPVAGPSRASISIDPLSPPPTSTATDFDNALPHQSQPQPQPQSQSQPVSSALLSHILFARRSNEVREASLSQESSGPVASYALETSVADPHSHTDLTMINTISTTELPAPHAVTALRRPMPRSASLTLTEVLRTAAQAELVRMQALQEQRRRSTSATITLSTVRSASLSTPAAVGHKRRWEETIQSNHFLEQAGAVAHDFAEFFTQERAWADMALAAAVRRDSELSSSEGSAGTAGTAGTTSRSSISTTGSRNSLSIPPPRISVGEKSGSAASLASNSGSISGVMPPPFKRFRSSISIPTPGMQPGLLSPPPFPGGRPLLDVRVPVIVKTSATPEPLTPTTLPTLDAAHLTSPAAGSMQTDVRDEMGPQDGSSFILASLSPISSQQSEAGPTASPSRSPTMPSAQHGQSSGANPSGSLVSVLSTFAQVLEGRQEVARGLEALARDGQQMLDEEASSAAVSELASISSAAAVEKTRLRILTGEALDAHTPSSESEDVPGSACMSEWTESSVADTAAGPGPVLGSGPGAGAAAEMLVRRRHSQRSLATTNDDEGQYALTNLGTAEATAAEAEKNEAPAAAAAAGISMSRSSLSDGAISISAAHALANATTTNSPSPRFYGGLNQHRPSVLANATLRRRSRSASPAPVAAPTSASFRNAAAPLGSPEPSASSSTAAFFSSPANKPSSFVPSASFSFSSSSVLGRRPSTACVSARASATVSPSPSTTHALLRRDALLLLVILNSSRPSARFGNKSSSGSGERVVCMEGAFAAQNGARR